MTVMVVGLVNAGVVALRPAISVIMGANIGTTLGNGPDRLAAGAAGFDPRGHLRAGLLLLEDREDPQYCAGLHGLCAHLLRPQPHDRRPSPAAQHARGDVGHFDAQGRHLHQPACLCRHRRFRDRDDPFLSSATIGIVMGLGAAGILDWQTAVAFSLGADLGTTITSWMASLNLSKNAKRAAYAHISFNIIGVLVTIPLFFVSMDILKWAMQWFGGDPSIPVLVNGKETFPLVPVAVGLYSTFFNIFNTALLFPFVGVFERVLSRVGRTDAEDIEDYSTPRFLDRKLAEDFAEAIPAVQQETNPPPSGRRDVPRHRAWFAQGPIRSW